MEMAIQSYMKKEGNMKNLKRKHVNVVCTRVNTRWIASVIIHRINLYIMRLNRAGRYQNTLMIRKLRQQK